MSPGEIFRRCRGQRRFVARPVVCAKPRSDGTFGDSKSLPSRGGPGGAFQKALCPPNAAVTAINIKHDRDYHITSVALTCKDVKTWQPSTAYFSGQGAYLDSRTYPCGSGELATG